ncbi:MAG TPA: anti-sigma factor [Gaiella sp.]|jgi:anti-sigma factor RsiW
METGIHELTAAYALDALEADERLAFEEHLRDCERCRDELASFLEVSSALAVAATGPEPRAELRERILAEAGSERQNVVPLQSRRPWLAPAMGVAAAVAAVVAIALGVYAFSLSGDLDDARSALDRQEQAAAVLADPSAQTVALQSGDGRLVVGDDGQAVLVLDTVDPAPAGKTYAVWIVEGAAPKPAGLFDGTTGRDVVPVDGAVTPGAVVAVTLERDGGVDVPTTQPFVASQPV